MDYFVSPYLWIAIGTLVGIFLFIVYKFRFEPLVQLPLANEEDLGNAEISIPSLGQLNSGRITSAMDTVKGWLAKSITNADESSRNALIAFRDVALKSYLLAQRCGRGKFIYVCDQNPMDSKFHTRKDKGSNTTRYIHAQDAMNLGVKDGFTWVGIKLGKEAVKFSEMERSVYDTVLTGMSVLRLASVNQGKIKSLEDRSKSLEDLLMNERKKHAETRSKLDRALSALEQKTLSTTGEAKVPGGFTAKLKEWFTWPQLVTAGLAYAISPLIIGALASNYGWAIQPPTTSYFTALVTAAGFFIIPFFKKVFGRWL